MKGIDTLFASMPNLPICNISDTRKFGKLNDTISDVCALIELESHILNITLFCGHILVNLRNVNKTMA